MKRLLMVLAALLLAGCAGVTTVQIPPQLFDDALFTAPRRQLSMDAIFALSPEMKTYAQTVRQNKQGKEARQALFDALYRRDRLKLEYDSALTRSAAEAFAARQGNCLSLTIMTAALADEIGVPVVFQSVATEAAWSRSGSLYFNIGHVNLLLGRPPRADMPLYDPNAYSLIDFLPPAEGALMRADRIDRPTVAAMFMNNRAAEALAQGDIDEAYWWARHAIETAPALLHAYNTLAIVYQRHGNHALAETALRHALRYDPDNTLMLSNLVQLLDDSGQPAEAARVKTRLATLQPYPPFYFFELGRKAMQAGDPAGARRLFERELRRDPDYHEFHFWLAQAAYQLGDLTTADRHMVQAMADSTTRHDHDLYAAKLDRLRAIEAGTRAH